MTHINEEMLRAYVAGALSAQEETEVMEHISKCDSCAVRFADMMTEKIQVSPPPDLKRDILEQTVYQKSPVRTIQEIQERKRAKQKELLVYSAKVVFAMAASILMVISVTSETADSLYKQRAANVKVLEQTTAKKETNRVSDSLQKASGKMGDALSDFLTFLTD